MFSLFLFFRTAGNVLDLERNTKIEFYLGNRRTTHVYLTLRFQKNASDFSPLNLDVNIFAYKKNWHTYRVSDSIEEAGSDVVKLCNINIHWQGSWRMCINLMFM